MKKFLREIYISEKNYKFPSTNYLTMKKIIRRSAGILFLVLILAVVLYISYIAHGITGYAVKGVSSGVFVSGRSQAGLEKEDLNFFPVKFARNYIDTLHKEAVSRLLLWKSKAVYNAGLGCTVVNDFPVEEVIDLNYPEVDIARLNQDTIPWPSGNLVSDTIPSGIDMQKINEILNRIFNDSVSRGTFAITVVYKDQLVAERYRSDIAPSSKLLGWSVGKSFTNALTGIMVKEGKIDVNKPLNLDKWKNDERRNITLNNLLHMNSGLEFNEEYSKIMLTDITTMLTKKGDMADYAASKKLVVRPDSIWNYSGGSTNIICDYIRSVIGNDAEYLAFPYKALFSKTGMLNTILEPDASGTFVGSSYVYATERDYARFGLLYLHNGNWFGEQILPEGWIGYTTTPARGSEGDYGAHFWINSSGEFPGLPADLFWADGHDGQFIFIIPSKNLVVTRNGFSPGTMFDEKAFLREIVEAIE
jgi:CubicO group peptidase (beta-lactamase class C family)